VQKEDRKYTLVASGEAIVKLLPPLNFVFQRWDFFRTHRLDLSPPLLQEIDALSQAILVRGLGQVLFKLEEVISATPEHEYFYVILDQSVPFCRSEPKPRGANIIIPESLSIDTMGPKPLKLMKPCNIERYLICCIGSTWRAVLGRSCVSRI